MPWLSTELFCAISIILVIVLFFSFWKWHEARDTSSAKSAVYCQASHVKEEKRQKSVTTAELDLRTVCNVLGTLRYKCYVIGVQFGIPHYKLKEFEKEDDPLAETVDYWLRGNVTDGVPLSWESVVAVLRSPQVDESGLASKIEEKYCSEKQQGKIEDFQKDIDVSSEAIAPSTNTSVSKNLGSSSFKIKLKKYKEQFQNYAKHRVCEYPSSAFDDVEDSEKVYKIKIEENIRIITGGDLMNYKYQVNKILGHTFLCLVDVKDGCMELTLRGFEDEQLMYISKEQKLELKKLGVISINYGNTVIFIINCEENTSEFDSGIHAPILKPASTHPTFSQFSDLYRTARGTSDNRSTLLHEERDLNDVRIDMITSNLSGLSPIYTAIKQQDIQQVKALVEGNENPVARDIDGNTSLHYAVKLGRYDILKYLIEEVECPPGIQGCHGATILHTAAETKQFAIVKYLVESEKCKLDPTTPDENNFSVLHYACRGGNLKIVRYLIECMTREYMKLEDVLYDTSPSTKSDADTKLFVDDFTRSPLLCCACYYGHSSIVKYLVEECHCDPFQAQGSKQITPIECAVAGNNLNIVKYLANRPHFHLPDIHEYSLLHLAAQYSYAKMVKYLTKTLKCNYNFKHGTTTPLHIASLSGKVDIVEYFISTLKCDPNIRGVDGYQPIHCAALKGQLKVIKYLMQKTIVDPKEITGHGEAILLLASTRGHMSVIKFLVLELYCDPSSMKNNYYSSLHYSAAEGQIDAFRFFVIECKCSPNIQTRDGLTPLHVAARSGKLEFVKFLVEELGCDPMIRNDEHQNAIHMAAKCGHLSVTKYLIEKLQLHFDIQSPDKSGKTIAHLAAEAGKLDILKYLVSELKMKVNQTHVDKNGHTPVCLAAVGGHLSVIKYLLEMGNKYYNSNSLTPLHYAAGNGFLDVVKYIMNNSDYQGMYSHNPNMTPLKYATRKNCLETVQYFVEDQGFDPCCIDESGNTLLHIAVEHGCLDTVQYLIANTNCSPFSRNYSQRTPLYSCITKAGQIKPFMSYSAIGHPTICQYLIRQLKIHWPHPTNLIHAAAKVGDLDLVKLLVDGDPNKCNDNGEQPIHFAAAGGHLNVIKYLVDEVKCDPMSLCNADDCDLKKCTPLHIASMEGHLNIVEYLLKEKKVDSFCFTSGGYTPMHCAAKYDKIEVVKYLAEVHPFYLITKTETNETPLQVAQQYNNTKTALFLKATMDNLSATYKLYLTTTQFVGATMHFLKVNSMIVIISGFIASTILLYLLILSFNFIPTMEISDYLEANRLRINDIGLDNIHPREKWDCIEAFYFRYFKSQLFMQFCFFPSAIIIIADLLSELLGHLISLLL